MRRFGLSWTPLAAARADRVAATLLLACGALAVFGCESVPTDVSPQPGPTVPSPVEPASPLPAEAGQAGQVASPAPLGQPGQVAAEPDHRIALLATRQFRCADPGPQGADAQRPSAEGFRDEAQWRAHLASIDHGVRAALASFEIDFKAGQSAALVRPGALPNLGYRISIPRDSLPVRAGTLALQMVVEPPPSHLLQAQVMAFPCIYLRLADSAYDRIDVGVERRPAP